jgi:hypothetical protein
LRGRKGKTQSSTESTKAFAKEGVSTTAKPGMVAAKDRAQIPARDKKGSSTTAESGEVLVKGVAPATTESGGESAKEGVLK